jgi:hypothetical protein
MAVGAVRHVLARTETRPTVRLVLRIGLVVAGTTSLTARQKELFELAMGHRVAVLVAGETVDSLVDRVFDVVSKCRSVAAGLVTVGAGRAVDLLEISLLGRSQSGTHHEAESDNGSRNQRGCEEG